MERMKFGVMYTDAKGIKENKMKITRRQLRKLVKEAIDRPNQGWYDDEAGYETLADRKFADSQQSPAHEDNQTRMVRRYLIQLGIGESFFQMDEEQIDTMAADLRLMSPSLKKHRDLYDLSLPTEEWLSQREESDEEPAYASHMDPHTTGYPGDDEILRQQELDDAQMSQPGGWYSGQGDDED